MKLRGGSIKGICLEETKSKNKCFCFLKKMTFGFLTVLVALFVIFECRFLIKIIVGNGKDSGLI